MVIGDKCDDCPDDPEPDFDEDSLCHSEDPCPADVGNDADGDGICESQDNCPAAFNPSQADSENNGVGDACRTGGTCDDGFDNDGDGKVDWTGGDPDPGCANILDATETDPGKECDNGIDDDGDTLIDFRADGTGDPGCSSLTSDKEDPECDNDQDDDADSLIDWDGGFGASFNSKDPACDGAPSFDDEGDNDRDGISDISDVCPKVADPGQEESTQTRLPGIGCACFCGDVTRDCILNTSDALEIQLFAGFGPRHSSSMRATATSTATRPATRAMRSRSSCGRDSSRQRWPSTPKTTAARSTDRRL